MKKNNFFIWVTDIYSNTGEGRLAFSFIKKLNKICKIDFEIQTNKNKYDNFKIFEKKVKNYNFKKSNFSLNDRYLIFLKGIFYLWINYIKGKRVVYINYLPLWNFFIFILCPPNTIFGPITGSSIRIIGRKHIFEKFIRNNIFPFFYFISVIFLKIRNSYYFFSTSLLNNNTTKLIQNNSIFNVQLLFLKKSEFKSKKIYDLVVYNRKHTNKNRINLKNIFKKKVYNNFKILCLGEKIRLKNIKNLGFISNKKLIKYLKKTKYGIISEENLYSFFFFDLVYAGTEPIISKKIKYDKNLVKIYNENKLDFNNEQNFSKKLVLILKNKKNKKIDIKHNLIKKISTKFETRLIRLIQ